MSAVNDVGEQNKREPFQNGRDLVIMKLDGGEGDRDSEN
jgi:hypothetical protein